MKVFYPLTRSFLCSLNSWARPGGRRLVLICWLGLLSLAAHAQRPTFQLDLVATPTSRDQTYVYFEQGATPGFDSNYDATKLPNSSGLNVASFADDGQQLAINGLPPNALDSPYTVDLFVGVPQYGIYSFEVSQLDYFDAVNIYLFDNLLNTSYMLALGSTYSFELTAANTNGTYTSSTRFKLLFTSATLPLPVTLTSFTAVGTSPVQLNWRTASEWNSAYFAVERSLNGKAFDEIGRVAAAGTSGQPRSYELRDAQPLKAAVAYYRLRQVDIDGSFQYSPVRVVAHRPVEAEIQLFPNPTRSAATLVGGTPGAVVQVFNTLGQLVTTATADATGAAALVLPSGHQTGLYVVRAGNQAVRLVVE